MGLLADEGSQEAAREVGLQEMLGHRGRREREWSDGFLELLIRLDAVVGRRWKSTELVGEDFWIGRGSRGRGDKRSGGGGMRRMGQAASKLGLD